MKLKFNLILIPALMVSSMALASAKEIAKIDPAFFEPGRLTSISVDQNTQLPNSYSEFVQLVDESFGPKSVVYGEVRYLTDADIICENAPGSRACFHARYFARIDEVPHAYTKETRKHPEMNYSKYDIAQQVLEYSPEYPMTKQIYISQQDAILFSGNSRVQSQMVDAMRAKLSKTKNHLAVIFQFGYAQDIPSTNRSYVPEDKVRIIDADCEFVGTPVEYLKATNCN